MSRVSARPPAGGEGAVGDVVVDDVDARATAVIRVAGPDRYGTSAAITAAAQAGLEAALAAG